MDASCLVCGGRKWISDDELWDETLEFTCADCGTRHEVGLDGCRALVDAPDTARDREAQPNAVRPLPVITVGPGVRQETLRMPLELRSVHDGRRLALPSSDADEAPQQRMASPPPLRMASWRLRAVAPIPDAAPSDPAPRHGHGEGAQPAILAGVDGEVAHVVDDDAELEQFIRRARRWSGRRVALNVALAIVCAVIWVMAVRG